MTRRLMLAVCWLSAATFFMSQNSALRLSAAAVGLSFGLYLTFLDIQDVRERRWTIGLFGLAIVVWGLTELSEPGSSARLVGFWTFIVVAVAAVVPNGGRFFGTLARRALNLK